MPQWAERSSAYRCLESRAKSTALLLGDTPLRNGLSQLLAANAEISKANMQIEDKQSSAGDGLPELASVFSAALLLHLQSDFDEAADGLGSAGRIFLTNGPSVHFLHELIGEPKRAHRVLSCGGPPRDWKHLRRA